MVRAIRDDMRRHKGEFVKRQNRKLKADGNSIVIKARNQTVRMSEIIISRRIRNINWE